MKKLEKVLIFGDEKKKIENLVKKIGFKIVSKKPDFVISFGGDGTFLKSEFLWPSVPKLVLKNSRVCKLCFNLSNEKVLKLVKENKFKLEKFYKLEANFKNQIIFATNEVVIKNKLPQHCIRYFIYIDDHKINQEIIGDGIVVSTVLGSTAYYRSITDSYFELGIGLAFNNSTEQVDHILLKETRKIKMVIERGPAMLYADNQEKIFDLETMDFVLIKKSKKYSTLIKLNL